MPRSAGHQPAPLDERVCVPAGLRTPDLSVETDEVFLSRFGDVIDDRLAAWIIWPATATICLAIACAIKGGLARPR